MNDQQRWSFFIFSEESMKLSTKAIHIGQEPDELTGAVTVPLYQTSTYAQEAIGKHKGWEYARTQNPTRSRWEDCIAAMEGGMAAYAFGSGLAAIDTIMRTLEAGDHVVMAEDMYGGTYRLAETILAKSGLSFSYVDMRNLENVRAAVTPATRMIYTETPTNPMMTITDLRGMAEIANGAGALLVVDNNFASPYPPPPIQLGGHSDLVHGVVITKHQEIADKLAYLQNSVGAVPGPLECWLCLRSAKTLHVRMDRHSSNAMKIAEWLEQHSAVEAVHYPGLKSHPQHELAKSQMDAFGGMISIELGSLENAKKFTERIKLFVLAESLGGVESLVCHPVSMTHGAVPKEQRDKLGITEGLVRLSVGIEDVDDLIADLENALMH